MAAVVCLPSGPGRWGRPVFPALVSAVVRPGLSVKPARNTCARTPLVSRAHARQREHAPRPVCTPPASTVRLCRPPPPPLFSARRGVRSVARAPLSAPRGRACCVCTRAARTCPVNKSPCGVHCTADREPPVPSMDASLALHLAPWGACLAELGRTPRRFRSTRHVLTLNFCGF